MGRRPVVLAAVLCLVLAVGLDPGSGTGVNFQAADDVAGLVIGAHHAKPLPEVPDVHHVPGGGLAVAVALLLVLVAPVRLGRHREPHPWTAFAVALGSSSSRRGPPVRSPST